MEKYRNTADPSTGIHPFLPPGTGEPVFIKRLALAILGVPLFMIRMPLLIIGFLLLLVTELIYFLPIPFLSRVLQRFGHWISCSLLLTSLGVWDVNFNLDTRISNNSGRARGSKSQAPKSGSLIVANHGSYVDILYLAKLYSPQFSYCTSDGLLIRRSIFKAVLDSFPRATISAKEKASAISVLELLERSRDRDLGPVVVFPEATTSNGRGILSFQRVLHDLPQTIAVHIIAFKYAEHRSRYSLALTVQNPIAHIIQTMILMRNELHVFVSPSVILEGSYPEEEARKIIATLLKRPILNVGLKERIQFEENWYRLRGKKAYKKSKSEESDS